jgi:hypothetical protein
MYDNKLIHLDQLIIKGFKSTVDIDQLEKISVFSDLIPPQSETDGNIKNVQAKAFYNFIQIFLQLNMRLL